MNLRDLIGRSGTVAEHATEPLLLPETLKVLDALRTMRNSASRWPCVVSEYGGIEWIVTV